MAGPTLPEHPWESSKQEQTEVSCRRRLLDHWMVSFETQLHAFYAHVYSALWVAAFLLLVNKSRNIWFHGGIISIGQGKFGSVSRPDLSDRV